MTNDALPVPPVPSKGPNYLMAVMFMAALVVIFVLVIEIARPEKDNTSLIAVVIGSLSTITLALLSMMKSQETQTKIQELKVVVDGRLTQLMEARVEAAQFKGENEGRAQERAEAGANNPAPPLPISERAARAPSDGEPLPVKVVAAVPVPVVETPNRPPATPPKP